LPFCQPSQIEEAAENLGEVMSGDRIENSPYEISLKLTETCKILCRKKYERKQLKKFAHRIDEDYRINWVVDNLPAATKYFQQNEHGEYVEQYDKGFPLGFVGTDEVQLA
jgi:transmembrane 9 superfamily protein 2/4